jgi:hypothetical protein
VFVSLLPRGIRKEGKIKERCEWMREKRET